MGNYDILHPHVSVCRRVRDTVHNDQRRAEIISVEFIKEVIENLVAFVDDADTTGKGFAVPDEPVSGNHRIIAMPEHQTAFALEKGVVQEFIPS
ncbi:hypothetical protein SDC9_38299 [bioreactor metagenome]|uniref:Uncharacterized protein n=1 Tax=bioreactor metagenome TaxID=1076179 RepID=A0A644VNS9_9ZZZZ